MNRTLQRLIATTLLSILPTQLLAQTTDAPGTPAARTGQQQVRATAGIGARATAATATDLIFFGPKKYVRTNGAKNVYTETIEVPAWMKAPFRLRVQNGEANGTYRVSSATVAVNGVEILTQSDFNQNAATYEKPVTLTAPKSTLVVTLASKPTSYLTMWLHGTTADLTAPRLTWTQPVTSSTINTPTPQLVVSYGDAAGTGEPAAAGVDLASLKVLIDDVDRSTLFTRRTDEASADIPATAPLAQGLHTYKASVADLAGNRTEITGQFRVDLTKPTIAFINPGAYLKTQAPQIKVTYADDVALNPATLGVTVNGAVVPSTSITTTATEAAIALTNLPEGPNQLTATIRDLGGNSATANLSFNVDVTAPTVTIPQPAAAARIGSRDVPLTIAYSDEQGIVATTATAKVDTTAVTLTATDDQATGQMTALTDGTHAITASVADRAGNIGTATSSFIIDTTVPTIKVVEPPAGANLRNAKPPVAITYTDEQGVQPDTLKVTLNATDQTALFTKTATGATGTVTTTLPEGVNKIDAEIKDATNNVGKTTSTFLVDTIVPAAQITAPADRVNTAKPVVTVAYSDAGSGINPDSLELKVDGTATTGVLVPGPDAASGALTTALTDGQHAVQIDLTDRAGNPSTLTKSFVVDTKAPVLTISAPADDSFINTTTPALRAGWADPQGTGVDLTSVKLTLQKGDAPALDITSYVTIAALEGVGFVPQTAALTDGTYRLTAEIRDLAGNVSTTVSSFEVDTVAPDYTIETPAANGYVDTRTPSFTIRWHDALSGVDLSRVVVTIDGVNRTARFTTSVDGATGTLTAAEALAEGAHTIQLTLYDRAGNKSPSQPQTFTVDTIDPVAAIEAPLNASYIGGAPHNLAVTYVDPTGSGIDPASVRITLDGTDRTADFTLGATRATATLATALTNGSHTLAVTILDWAGNPATATSTFTVDAIAPAVTITTPEANAWLKGATVTVTGTVVETSPVTLTVNNVPAIVTAGKFSVAVPSSEGAFVILVVAVDAAGNSGSGSVSVNVDTQAPVITIAEPLNNAITNKASIRVAGTVADASIVTMTLDGAPLPLTSNAFSTDVPLTADGLRTLVLVATDAAGNTSTSSVKVTRDTVDPVVTVAAPAKASVIGTVPVVVRGTLQDATAVAVTVDGTAATVTNAAWQASISGLSEGKHSFTIVAVDAAGNDTTVEHEVSIDTLAPLVVIATPAPATLTKDATITITGTATDGTLATVTAAGVTATLVAGTTADEKKFTLTNVPLIDGDNTIVILATDALGRTGQASIMITRDSVPPSLLVDAPELITRTRATNVSAVVEDNLALRDVVFTLGTTELAKVTKAPFTASVIAPSTAKPGDVLTLTVVATDKAGNATTVTKSLRVTSDGAVTGLVLDDSTGLPIRNARVRVTGGTLETTTDERGRYALPANEQNLVLIVDQPVVGQTPMTAVERTVAIQSGVGTVPVDVRLTPLAQPVEIGQHGGFVVNATYGITVPGGAVSAATPMRLTRLSSQGLPNLLPLGWSPVAAFDFRVDGTVANVPFEANLSSLSDATLTLVHYSPSLHAWNVVATGLVTVGGSLRVSLPETGAYAFVVADGTHVPAAVAGQLLPGIDMQPIPETATSSGSVNPPTLPPTGGAATGTLIVHSPTPLPSGTVVQAEVTETFSLTNGEVASEETRTQDLVLYRAGNDIKAEFPIVPSRSFTAGDLAEGKVHLDILAGREAVRGKTGGSQALTLTSGDVALTVPAGALPQDLAISATPAILSSFLPSTPAAAPFAEVVLDFGGAVLATPAELSVSASNVPAGQTVVIARIERVRGVPKAVVVAGTELQNGRFVSAPLGDLPSIRRDGRYVFYRINLAWGLVTGAIGFPTGTGPATVQIAGFPFTAITKSSGQFTAIAPAGTPRVLTATIAGTSLSGQTSVLVTAGGTTTATFSLTAAATTATVTPADGAIRVPTSSQVEITATAPLSVTSANSGTIRLTTDAGAVVPVRYVFSGSGRVLAVIPQDALEPGTTYRLDVDGLTDIYGGAVNVAGSSFTTAANTQPQYDMNRIVILMPENGMIKVNAPAGSLPPGTQVLIVNTGNASVVSLMVGNDGSFTGEIPGSINDVLLITVSDPLGNVYSFERSKFVATDGSGRVAIGAAGGTVEGPGGTGLIIPAGALTRGAVFRVEPFGPEAFEERPEFPGVQFGSGLRIISEDKPTLKEEGKLVFPRPAGAPDGAFYYVLRRVTGPNGRVDFETVDHAFLTAEGNVVTASYPFIGWNDSVGSWDAASSAIGFGLSAVVNMFLMWSYDAMLPGLPLPGMIVGKAYEVRYERGNPEPVYVPVNGAMISAIDESGLLLWDKPSTRGIFARSQDAPGTLFSEHKGTFALWDPQYRGGPVRIHAMYNGHSVVTTAYQANPVDTKTFFTHLFQHYRNVAYATVTFPSSEPPQAPAIEIVLMTVDAEGRRQVVSDDMVLAGTNVLIGLKVNTEEEMTIRAEVGGIEMAVKRDVDSSPQRVTWILVGDKPGVSITPPAVGRYNVTGTAFPPFGSAIALSYSFIAVSGTSGNTKALPGPPDVLVNQLRPKNGKTDVLIDTFVEVVFTEPVKNVPPAIKLVGPEGEVLCAVSGVGVDAQGRISIISDLAANPSAAVTAVTLRPVYGLRLGSSYQIQLGGGIIDLDETNGQPDPKSLSPRVYSFSTYNASVIAEADDYASLGSVAFGETVWVAEDGRPHGQLRGYRYSNNSLSALSGTFLSGTPTHIAGEQASAVFGSDVVAVPATLWYLRGPSNLIIYDTTAQPPVRRAAVSLTEGTEHGITLRVAVKGRYAYAWTYPTGIQIVDLQRAKLNFDLASADARRSRDMNLALVTAGQGFSQDAIVNVIPVRTVTGALGHIFGVVPFDTMIDGTSQTLVLATGNVPLVVANPQSGEIVYRDAVLQSAEGSLTWGWAMAADYHDGKPLAVIVGRGTGRNPQNELAAGNVLVVVDLSSPRSPKIIGSLLFSGTDTPTDVKVQGTNAFVAFGDRLIVVNIADPAKPANGGTIAAMGGRLSVSETGAIFSTGSDGVRVAQLTPPEAAFRITEIKPDVVSPANPPVDGDTKYYSIPSSFGPTTNTMARTFRMKLTGRPPNSVVTKVKVTLVGATPNGSRDLATVYDGAVDGTNATLNGDALRVRVTFHTLASQLAGRPPDAHTISYRFDVTATIGGRAVSASAVTPTPRFALWRMPPTLTRYSTRDAGQDDWSSKGTYQWLTDNQTRLKAINDVSGEHGKCIGHVSHTQGTDIDMFHFYTFPGNAHQHGGTNYEKLKTYFSSAAGGNAEAKEQLIAWAKATRTGMEPLLSDDRVSKVIYVSGGSRTATRKRPDGTKYQVPIETSYEAGFGEKLLKTGKAKYNGTTVDLGIGDWTPAKLENYRPRNDHNDHVHITLSPEKMGEVKQKMSPTGQCRDENP
ncbi:MAG TPA: Ig-like domain-containing protein [Thermoanaerobaculia bacterium]